MWTYWKLRLKDETTNRRTTRFVAAAVMFALGDVSQMGKTALSSWHIWVQLNDVANADRTFGFFWLTFVSASWHVQVPRSCLLLKAWRVTQRFIDAGRPGQAQRWDGQRLRTLRSSSLSGTKRRLVMERETQHGARQRLRLFINYPHLPWFVQLCLSSMVWSKCAVTVRKAVRPGLRRFKCLNPTFEIPLRSALRSSHFRSVKCSLPWHASDPPRLKQFSHQIGHGLVAPLREKVALQGRCCHFGHTWMGHRFRFKRRSLHVLQVVECVPRLAGRSLNPGLQSWCSYESSLVSIV